MNAVVSRYQTSLFVANNTILIAGCVLYLSVSRAELLGSEVATVCAASVIGRLRGGRAWVGRRRPAQHISLAHPDDDLPAHYAPHTPPRQRPPTSHPLPREAPVACEYVRHPRMKVHCRLTPVRLSLPCIEPEEQHPHPFAPPELKQRFSEFVQKFQSAPGASVSASPSAAGVKKSGAGNGPAFEDFWQAPSR